jgi:D-glycero-D-manno-heptose 1,7-bisphosphate phosphatase
MAEIPPVNGVRRPAVFFDRDGVLNVDDGFVHRPEHLRWIDGAAAAVRAVNQAGWFAFVVTNQAGIGHGYHSEADVLAFHAQMSAHLREQGGRIDEYVFCPYHPEARLEAYRQDSPHRKPGPGMILDLMSRWPVDQARSFLVGDRESDLEAAARASIDAYQYRGGSLYELVVAALRQRGAAI